MKNSKMLLALATSMATASVSAENNPHVLSIGEHCSIGISTNDMRDNGNVVHKIMKNDGNKDFKCSVHIDFYPFALGDDIKAAIQQPPYNQFPEALATRLYLENKYAYSDEDVALMTQENLRALLSEKDENGKTPVELMREKSIGNPMFADGVKGFEVLEVLEPESQEAKQLRLERRAREQEERILRMALMAAMFPKQ